MENIDAQDYRESRHDIKGFLCPYLKGEPAVVELPGIAGFYVPVFKKPEDLEDAMRYLDVQRYEKVVVGSSQHFLDFVERAGACVVLNPRAFEGRCAWDEILPHPPGIIVPA